MNKKIPIIILGAVIVILAATAYYHNYKRQAVIEAPGADAPAAVEKPEEKAATSGPLIEVNRVSRQYGYIRTFENRDGAQYVNIDPIDYYSQEEGNCRSVSGEDLCGPQGVGIENKVYELYAMPLAADVYIQDLAGREVPLPSLVQDDPQARKEVPYRMESEKGLVVRIYEVAGP